MAFFKNKNKKLKPVRFSKPKKFKGEKLKKPFRSKFPEKFPFWARLKIGKNRTTLVIDEDLALNKRTKKTEYGFVHREAIHTQNNKYEEIKPNPDKDDPRPMYLKKPAKLPQRLFNSHNKSFSVPQNLKERYNKNNKK